MQVGDLVRIKLHLQDPEFQFEDNYPPPESQWIGLVMETEEEDEDVHDSDKCVYIKWCWSGRTVLEYAEHLEVIPCE